MIGDRIIVYLFPAYLLAIEIFFRSALTLDTEAFAGPVLASIGLNFLISSTIPQKCIIKKDKTILLNKERYLIQCCWIAILVLIPIWIWSLILTTYTTQKLLFLHVGWYIGTIHCILGIISCEIKAHLQNS